MCDDEAPYVSVWKGSGATIEPVQWPWAGPGLSAVFRRFSQSLGFRSETGDHQLEALARLRPDRVDGRVDALVTFDDGVIAIDPGIDGLLEQWLAGDHDLGSPARAHMASALQLRLGDVLLELLEAVRHHLGVHHLCVGGSFFPFVDQHDGEAAAACATDVFVPVDPGNGGLAVGAALHANGAPPAPVSPFWGRRTCDEIKRDLDNCKLNYSWESEGGVIAAAVEASRTGASSAGSTVPWSGAHARWARAASWPTLRRRTCSKT